jgi:hypothetical protein|tara:strand:- start:2466 stop:2567 length:102 start_codon:yes stop_codon:yes gene_type:complete
MKLRLLALLDEGKVGRFFMAAGFALGLLFGLII